MLSALLKVSGMLILKLVYGKSFSERGSKKTGLMLLLSTANIMWLICVLFLVAGNTANATALCVIMAVVYPVVIAVWAVLERKKAYKE